eukprot:6196544-Pleurochrysis_carterae.AAC.4
MRVQARPTCECSTHDRIACRVRKDLTHSASRVTKRSRVAPMAAWYARKRSDQARLPPSASRMSRWCSSFHSSALCTLRSSGARHQPKLSYKWSIVAAATRAGDSRRDKGQTGDAGDGRRTWVGGRTGRGQGRTLQACGPACFLEHANQQ